MGAAISSTLTMGLTYACCSATGSLCNACLGSTAEGSTGRKRSVLLLTMAIALALWFQYSVGPSIITQSGTLWKTLRWIPGMSSLLYSPWHKGCEQYDDDDHLLELCAGNAGVYRPTATATLFFALTAVATRIQPHLNKEAWPAKYTLFLFAVAVTMFLSNAPLFTGFYLWTARFGATIFVVLQQVILIDIAYNWNEDWVARADQADRLSYGSGSTWLQSIVGTSIAFYLATLTGIGLLYQYFSGCSENIWIITLTLLGVIALTVIQLSGTEGSLLTSSVLSLYVTYLAYSMVSKNPNGECNPQLGSNDAWGIVIGLTLTALSLAWTGWSWTAEERLNVDGVQSARPMTGSSPTPSTPGQGPNLDVPFLDPEDQQTTGLVLDAETNLTRSNSGGVGSDIWKLNVVMAIIACFVAMTLTGWGSLDADANAANPTVSRVNMAMLGVSQWITIGLYVWTLAAPALFPDRDFS